MLVSRRDQSFSNPRNAGPRRHAAVRSEIEGWEKIFRGTAKIPLLSQPGRLGSRTLQIIHGKKHGKAAKTQPEAVCARQAGSRTRVVHRSAQRCPRVVALRSQQSGADQPMETISAHYAPLQSAQPSNLVSVTAALWNRLTGSDPDPPIQISLAVRSRYETTPRKRTTFSTLVVKARQASKAEAATVSAPG